MTTITNNLEMNVVDNSADTAPEPIIMRRDSANNLVCFLLSKLSVGSSKDDGTIGVWHVGGERKFAIVPLSYYQSCKGIDDLTAISLAQKFAESYKPRFGISVRHRLFKDHKGFVAVKNTLITTTVGHRRSTDSKPMDNEMYMKKINAAIAAAIAAVNDSYK